MICGASAGGGSYSPALTDFVVMTERGNMFLTGPAVVKEVMGEDVGAFELGGPKVHDRNGVAHFVARTDTDAALLVRDLLDHLPSHAGGAVPLARRGPIGSNPGEVVPESERMVYDVRDVVRGVVDGGRCSSGARAGRAASSAASRGWRASRSASSPTSRSSWAACSTPTRRPKREVRAHLQRVRHPAARVRRHPGFMPGTKQEKGGVIRHGAKLVHAFAEASVPKVTPCCARRSAARSSR